MSRTFNVVAGAGSVPFSLTDPATPGGQQPDGGLTGWTLKFSEEFNGSPIVTDATLGYVKFRNGGPEWATWYPNWPRFTAQSPGGNHTNTNVNAYYATSRVTTSGGACVLTADNTVTVSGLAYTAGMIQSLPSYTPKFGFMEARIRLASMPTALWPAGWMSNSVFDQWPPEIDYMEAGLTGAGVNLNNVYNPGDATFSVSNSGVTFSNFNTFGANWQGSTVTFYMNGSQTAQATRTVNTNMYLLFDLAVDAGQSASFSSATMEIDYVRYWQ